MSYAVAWQPDGLYVFIQVEDPDRNPAPLSSLSWAGDAAEIYVDADGTYPPPGTWDDPGARQFVFAAPSADSTPSDRAQRFVDFGVVGSWVSTQFACVPSAAGYDVEAFIRAADLDLASWSLAAGSQVGFDLAHDVSVPPGQTGTEGNRNSQYFLRVQQPSQGTVYDYPFRNENAYCTATLVAK